MSRYSNQTQNEPTKQTHEEGRTFIWVYQSIVGTVEQAVPSETGITREGQFQRIAGTLGLYKEITLEL